MYDDKADQQEDPEAGTNSNDDSKDNEFAERDLENGEVTNEILEAGETSTDGLDEDSDGDITHEIRIESDMLSITYLLPPGRDNRAILRL
jgi:hypothetical protein